MAAHISAHRIGCAEHGSTFTREEPGLVATAFALPQQHAYGAPDYQNGQECAPPGQLRTVLDELVDASMLGRQR